MMTLSTPHTVVLTCHPEARGQAVHGIEARVGWTQNGAIALSYTLKANLSRLRIPPPRPPRRLDGLWQHTCFEAFFSMKGDPAYYEFNFAPSGEWAAYGFRAYRDGALQVNDDLTPGITMRSAGDSLVLDATLRLDCLPTIQSGALLRLGLSAVVEDESGAFSYWALNHPPGKPDFHHRDAFALEIEAPQVDAVNDPAYTGKT